MFRKAIIASLFLVAPAFATGCFTEEPTEAPDGETSEDRGPIGKADLFGQCMEIDINYCGLKSSGNCYCDDLCETFGDCCSDYVDACTGGGEPACDPTLICGQAISCVDGQLYPTTCGPANCDAPMGDCGDPEPTVCGGWLGDTCAADEFCNFDKEAFCGFADASGTCEAMPQICPEVYSPVCGCDGNTYSNACDANAAGTSVQKTGDCDCPDGQTKQFCWGQSQCVPIGAQC